MKFTTIQKAFLAVIIANTIWGAAAPIFKLSLQNIPPFTLAFWRFFLGALILLAFLGKKAKIPTSSRRDLGLLIGYALTGITINIMFFFWGLQRTYAINSPVITSASPVMTYFLALIFLHEHASTKKLFGMIVGCLGIIVIVLEPILKTGLDGSLIGNLFLVIATIAAVVQTIFGKEALPKFEPFAFTFWAFIIGAASFLPLAILEYVKIPHLYAAIDYRGYLGVAYGAIFSSAIGYGLYAWGLSKMSATDSALFSYIDPISGTILAYFLLHEPITGYFILGTALIFGGIFIAEGRLHYHPFNKLRSITIKVPPAVITTPVENTPVPKKKVRSVIAGIFDKKT